ENIDEKSPGNNRRYMRAIKFECNLQFLDPNRQTTSRHHHLSQWFSSHIIPWIKVINQSITGNKKSLSRPTITAPIDAKPIQWNSHITSDGASNSHNNDNNNCNGNSNGNNSSTDMDGNDINHNMDG